MHTKIASGAYLNIYLNSRKMSQQPFYASSWLSKNFIRVEGVVIEYSRVTCTPSMQPRLVSAHGIQDRNLEALDRSAAFYRIRACSMGCASTSVAGRSASVLEEAAPNTNTATTGGYMAKVHPLRRMDALDKNNCNLHSLPSTPTSGIPEKIHSEKSVRNVRTRTDKFNFV